MTFWIRSKTDRRLINFIIPIYRSATVGVALLSFTAGLAAAPTTRPAATEPTTSPTTLPFKTSDALDQIIFNKMILLERDHQQQLNVLRQERVNGLRALLDLAIANKDSDGAARLKTKLAIAQDSLSSSEDAVDMKLLRDDRSAFEKSLRDSTWEWADDTIKFEANGNVANKGWTSRGLVTTWKVVDRRTVMLFIKTGRDFNRMTILDFNNDIDNYTGFSFEGSPLSGHKK